MELLEGETLRGRLARGPFPVAKAVELAEQICQGLAAAHGKGIVHRDLKPENLFLTREGPKILDFGLARRVGGLEGGEAASPRTRSGLVLGTVGYLSPEQARGEAADARSDVFALGTVLYEMLSGRRAFRKETAAETLTAILKEEPPELVVPGGLVPAALGRIVRRCLEKDPEDRFQSARDVAFALDATSETWEGSGQGSRESRGQRVSRRWVVPAMAAVALAALLVGALAERLWQRPPESGRAARVVRSQIDLPSDRPLFGPRSPGSHGAGPQPRRDAPRVDVSSADPLMCSLPSAPGYRRGDAAAGGREATSRSFSGRSLDRVPLQRRRQAAVAQGPRRGGLPVDVAELSRVPMGATWGLDDRIYLGSLVKGLQAVPAEGGPLRDVTTIDPGREVAHRLPSVLPGRRELLVTVPANLYGLKTRIEVVSLATGKRKVVVEDGGDGRYLPSGHLVFVRQGVLMAAPFDLGRLELAAPPVSVIGALSQALNAPGEAGNSGAAQFAASDRGFSPMPRVACSRILRSSCFSWTGRAAPNHCPASTGRWSALSSASRPTAGFSPSTSRRGRASSGCSMPASDLPRLVRQRHRRLPAVEPGREAARRGLVGGRTHAALDRARREGRVGAPHDD